MKKQPPPARKPASRSRRYKHHQLELTDGTKLVLLVDGSIRHIDARGSTARTWTLDDLEWPDQALRFGLHPQPLTVAPQGHQVQATKNKRW